MTSSSAFTIGVDVGGTVVKLGLLRGTRILERRFLSTRSLSSRGELLDKIAESVRFWLASHPRKVRSIGVGVPGLVKFPQGVVRSVVNLPGKWRNVPLRRLLEKRLKVPVRVDNDVNLMTLAEWRCGAGRGAKNLICLTLGTGVGGGLILDGELYRGNTGSAGEIGHMPLQGQGPSCPCGGIACLERYVGNREVLRWVKRKLASGVRSHIRTLIGSHLDRLTPEIIDRACELGDPLARQTWALAGSRIGWVLAGVVNLLNPERIVIGGGMAKAGRWIFKPIRQTLARRAMRGVGTIPVVAAKLGESAGLIGAALLAQEGGDRG